MIESVTTNINLHDNKHQLILLAVMTTIWTIFYTSIHFLFKPKTKLNKKILLDTKNRIVSIVHGVVSFILAGYCFLTQEFE